MRKVTFFAVAAGAGVLFTGCVDDVMRDRHYIPAPLDNVPVVETQSRQEQIKQDPATLPEKPVAVTPQYEPMTDVTSTGGVDDASGADTKSSGQTIYIVKKGDYPERIARKHKVRLKALMKANNLTEASARKLRVGQKLVIPGGKSSAVAPTSKSEKKDSASQSSASLKGGKYSVKKGDTPERIARRFKVKLADLMKANNLDEAAARRLQVGQKLVIPGKSDTTADTTADTTNTSDTPADTADTTDASTDTGKGQETESQPSGTSDTMAVELDREMTWEEVAEKYNTTVEVLRELNVGIEGSTLPKEEMIVVPVKK